MLNYNHLYYFHVVADEGSLTAAAERLGVSLSTVSEQVRQLERSLGVALFERGGSALRLTLAGQLAHEHTSVMFRAGERLSEALGHKTEDAPAVLNVGITATVSRTLATDFLMPVLALEECFPTVRTASFTDLLRDLHTHELDIVLCDTEPVEAARRGLECITMHKPKLIAVGNIEFEPTATWDNVKLLQYRQGTAYRWEVDHYLDANHLVPRVMGECDDAFLLLESVIRGGFVAFVPHSVARDALAANRVKRLLALEAGSAGVFAIYHDGDSAVLARKAVQLLADYANAGNFTS